MGNLFFCFRDRQPDKNTDKKDYDIVNSNLFIYPKNKFGKTKLYFWRQSQSDLN